ncbi:flagellar basal body protein [Jannaschia donghaensis]|nr:flagellar basal body protein [Jannaschia donghaensis]
MPDILRLAAGAAAHSANRQGVIAANVANADTPGFRARDMAAFSPDDGFQLRRTDARHMAGQAGRAETFALKQAMADPNGNTVDLEDQVLRGIEASRAHNRAITVYRNNLDILRAALGRR